MFITDVEKQMFVSETQLYAMVEGVGSESHHRDSAESSWRRLGESFVHVLLCSLRSGSFLLEGQDFGGLAEAAATEEAVCQLATVVLLPSMQTQHE